MSAKHNFLKSTALILAGSFIAGTLMPIMSASAHDRHNISRHYGYGTPLTRNGHKKFHRAYGPGDHGRQNFLYQNGAHYNSHSTYHYHEPQVVYKKKKRSNGDLIAAGIIGLAVGAIIAGEASKRKRHQPSYQYHQPHRSGHIPLNSYNGNSQNHSHNGGPNVITYNDNYSLEPWTPGWRSWCKNRYRSFNQQTGTFRGYDGKDHFCVPK